MRKPFDIPISTEMHGFKIKTVFSDIMLSQDDDLGEAVYRCDEIKVQKLAPNLALTKTRQEQVYFHELTHHILLHAGYKKLASDEDFVERIGYLLHQAVTSFEYGEEK